MDLCSLHLRSLQCQRILLLQATKQGAEDFIAALAHSHAEAALLLLFQDLDPPSREGLQMAGLAVMVWAK